MHGQVELRTKVCKVLMPNRMTTADAELGQKQHGASLPLPQSTREKQEVNDQDVQDDEEENVKKKQKEQKQQNLKHVSGDDDDDGVPKRDDNMQKETSPVSSESKQNDDRKELDNNEKVGSYCLGN
jgi:hypothetical protein